MYIEIAPNFHEHGNSPMEQISWTEEWSVGHDEIDKQHQNILAIINRLIGLHDYETNSSVLFSLIIDFQICANEHLHYEEYLLSKNNYQDIDDHKKMHRHYLDKFYTQLSVVRENASYQNIYDLVLLLSDWWSQHICIEDIKYRPLFEKHESNEEM